MSKITIAALALLAAMPAAAQMKASGVPLRAKVNLAQTQDAPALGAAALGRIAAEAELPRDLQGRERAMFVRVSERLRHKDRAAAMDAWEGAIRVMRSRGAAPDVDALANWVLNQAYLSQDPALRARADKARFFHEQREAAYASKAELERTQSSVRRGATATMRPVALTSAYRPGARAAAAAAPQPATVESVARELQRITVLCNTAEENAQMANMDLQNALQKQQQTLQTMSNVSKAMHDSAKAIINNMKG